MTVSAAVSELKEWIEQEGFKQSRLEEVAEDFDLNPKLLDRKFAETTGKAPSEWTAPVAPQAVTMSARAEAEALRWAGEYRMSPEASRLVGSKFTFQGEAFLYVVIQSGCPKWGLKAIRVRDGARQQISRPAWNAILAQVSKQKEAA